MRCAIFRETARLNNEPTRPSFLKLADGPQQSGPSGSGGSYRWGLWRAAGNNDRSERNGSDCASRRQQAGGGSSADNELALARGLKEGHSQVVVLRRSIEACFGAKRRRTTFVGAGSFRAILQVVPRRSQRLRTCGSNSSLQIQNPSWSGKPLTVRRPSFHTAPIFRERIMYSIIAGTLIVLSIGIFMAHAMDAFNSGRGH